MSVEIWNIENDLCRCCHAEGNFDNLAMPQTYIDDVEIYIDMLKDCLNIEVLPIPGDLCVVTYKICKECIKKLQNASRFKKQVKKCENHFMEMYHTNRIRALNSNSDVVVKEEEEVHSTDLKENEEIPSHVDDDYHITDFDNVNKDKEWSDDELISSLSKKRKIEKPKSYKKFRKVESKNVTKKATQPRRIDSIYDKNYTLREESGSSRYTCNICSKSYKKFDGFKQHYRHVHLKQRPKLIGCYYCTEKVSHHKRASHLEQVHGVPAPSCGACGKKFNFPFQVLRHHKTYHMGEKKFVCKICDRLFASNAYLTAHMIKHSSERPFRCDVCEDTFKWKKHLNRHVMLHLSRNQK